MNTTAILDTLPGNCQNITVYLTVLFAFSTCLSEWLGFSSCPHNGMVHGIFNQLKRDDDKQGVAP